MPRRISDSEVYKRTYTFRELLAASGCTRLQIDNWIKLGLIDVEPFPGSGNHRAYSFANVFEANLVAELRRSFTHDEMVQIFGRLRTFMTKITLPGVHGGTDEGRGWQFIIHPIKGRVVEGDRRAIEREDLAVDEMGPDFKFLRRSAYPGAPRLTIVNLTAILHDALDRTKDVIH